MGQVLTPAFPALANPSGCSTVTSDELPARLPAQPVDGTTMHTWSITAIGAEGHKRSWTAYATSGHEVAQEVESRLHGQPVRLQIVRRGVYAGPWAAPAVPQIDVSRCARSHRAAAWLGAPTQIDTDLDQADATAPDSTLIHSPAGRVSGARSWIGAIAIGAVIVTGLGIAAWSAWATSSTADTIRITRPATVTL
jgi:hypothetical protein